MTIQLALIAAAIACALAGIVITPRNRRTIAVLCVFGLVAIVAVPPAFGGWTIGAAGDGHTQPTVTSTPFNATSISAPSSLACAWSNADASTTVNLSWTAGSSWAQTEVQRKTTGSFADYSSVGPETTTKADAAANSPTSTNYSYQVNHRAGNSTWLSAYSNTVTSNTCKDAVALVASDGTAAGINSLLKTPTDVAFDSNGDAIIADSGDHKVRCIAAVTTANACFQASPVVGYIYTIAGTGTAGSLSDNVAATTAKLDTPTGVAVDSSGNVFIADSVNCNVRVVWAGGSNNYNINTLYSIGSPTVGNIYRVAGQVSTCGYGGDGATATTSGSKLKNPTDVAVDSSGNLYISDTGNALIRKVTTGDTFSTIAGTSSGTPPNTCATPTAGPPSCGDSGAATSATMTSPKGIAVDSSGDVIFADTGDHEVRVIAGTTATHFGVSMTAGNIYKLAGTGSASTDADGTTATSARLSSPWGVDVDSSGDVVVGDTGNDLVRVIAGTTATHFGMNMTAQKIYTIGGVAATTTYLGDGYPANGTGAQNLNTPDGIAIDPTHTSTVWVSIGVANGMVEMIDGTNNLVFTKAGQSAATATPTNANGDGAISAQWEIANPYHSALDSSGNLYFADHGDNRIREWVASTGEVRTIAGTGASGDGVSGNALAAALNAPQGVAFDTSGNLYIADTGNNKIKKVVITAGGTNGGTIGNISVIAGPTGSGTTTACANPWSCGDGGAATSGLFSGPTDIAIDGSNNIIVADEGDCTIRLIDATTPLYGSARTATDVYRIGGTYGTCTNNDNATATSGTMANPYGIDVDSSGNIYIAQYVGSLYVKIRKIDSGDALTTIAGTGAAGSADGNATSTATFLLPMDVSWDASNSTLYIADTNNSKIRTLSGSTVATLGGGGSASPGYGGAALGAGLSAPYGVSVKSDGDLFVTSGSNNADIKRIYGPNPR